MVLTMWSAHFFFMTSTFLPRSFCSQVGRAFSEYFQNMTVQRGSWLLQSTVAFSDNLCSWHLFFFAPYFIQLITVHMGIRPCAWHGRLFELPGGGATWMATAVLQARG